MKKKIKDKIIDALEGNEKRVLHIEISKSEWKPNTWCVRTGDIKGSTEMSNVSKKNVISEIESEMGELKK